MKASRRTKKQHAATKDKRPVKSLEPWAWRDKFYIGFIIFLVLFVTGLLGHFVSVGQQQASVSRTVEGWRSIYHLTDDQVRQIKEIETDFHGNGSPFSMKPVHSHHEIDRHHEYIGSLMTPEDAVRFKSAMSKVHGRN